MILPDNETKIDLLNNEAIAQTIVTILREKPDKPVTIGVHGDWGAGKSSILEMVDSILSSEEKVACIKFNGWQFQGIEDAKIALIEGIVTTLVESRPAVRKAGDKVKDVLKRIDWIKAAKKAGGLAWTAFTGLPNPKQIQSIVSTIKSWGGSPTEHITKENIESVARNLNGLLKPSEVKRVPEEVKEFHKAFDELLDAADIEQLIVLIDDLDRCLPETAIETLEAARLFIFTNRTAFIIGADEAMIEYSVRKHFPDLPDSTGPRDYARNYLEKLIQIPFRIPTLGEAETKTYITLLLVGAVLGEENSEFQKLIVEAKELLKRPWTNAGLDSATVNKVLENYKKDVAEVLQVSEQISTILTTGTNGNPRQIKRFLNALLLRKRIAEARGFGDDINLPKLAKLMLAERFIPHLFDYMVGSVNSASNGICKDLAEIEKAHEQQKDGEKIKKSKTNVSTSVTSAENWFTDTVIKNWASINPKLADTDLRPYLFVAKDKKDYFQGSSALGKFSVIAEKLLGRKFAITAAGMRSELQKLIPTEATNVFDILKQKIIYKDSLINEPEGMAGIVMLVEVHQHLETNLLDMLEDLQAKKLGVWVISGWGSCLRSDESKVRFKTLLEKWAVSGEPFLKSAATNALKVKIK